MASQAGRTIRGVGAGGSGSRTLWVAILASTLVASLLPAGGALAQEPDQVTGLAVEQQHGFATLSWNPVEGATAYEIERTPVDESDQPTGPPVITGVWRPNRQVDQESPAFADAGFNPGDRFSWRVRALPAGGLPNQVTIDPPSAAAGTYGATGASFGPSLDDTGLAGDIVVVDDGTDSPTEGCSELVGFPAGAVALADRGGCTFVQKVNNAQDAGAIAAIVANNTGGDPINMSGSDPGITIPSVMCRSPTATRSRQGCPPPAGSQGVRNYRSPIL